MSPVLCLNCGLVALVNESKEEQGEKNEKWILTPINLSPDGDQSDFTKIVDEEFFSHNVRWVLEGFCSTENGRLSISSGWMDSCKAHQIDNVGVGIFSSWAVHSSRGYSALLVVYDSLMTIDIYEKLQSTKSKDLIENYLEVTSRIFDQFLNSILNQSTYEYMGCLTSGTTSLSQYGEGSGLLVLGEAGKDKGSNSPFLPYTSPHSGEFKIYDVFQEGDKKVATLIIPSVGAEILNLKKKSQDTPHIGSWEVRNFGVPIDSFTASLNFAIQAVNLELMRGKSIDRSVEALFTCRSNAWALLERALLEGVDFEEVVSSVYKQNEQKEWGDIVLQLRGRKPEEI